MTCDLCPNPAAYHLTDVQDGKPLTRHLCLSCAKDVLPAIPGRTLPDLALTKLPPTLQQCSRCGAPTVVVVWAEEQLALDKSTKRLRSRAALCAACASAEAIAYTPAPAEHVATVVQRPSEP